MGWHDQRPHDAFRRLGQAAHRPCHPHDGRFRRLLRHVDLRRPADVLEGGQLAVTLHRLDHRPRSLRRPRLGWDDLVRRPLLPVPMALETPRSLFHAARRMALLALDHRHPSLHHRHVGVGNSAGPDVARLR